MAEDAGVPEPSARHPSILSEDDLKVHGGVGLVGLEIRTKLQETIPNGALATFEVVRTKCLEPQGGYAGKLVARISASRSRIYVRGWPETEEEWNAVNAALQKAWSLHQRLAASVHEPAE